MVNIKNMHNRLDEIARTPGALENLIINKPATDTDYTQWSERLYSKYEIDVIIKNSGLIVKRPIHTNILSAALK